MSDFQNIYLSLWILYYYMYGYCIFAANNINLFEGFTIHIIEMRSNVCLQHALLWLLQLYNLFKQRLYTVTQILRIQTLKIWCDTKFYADVCILKAFRKQLLIVYCCDNDRTSHWNPYSHTRTVLYYENYASLVAYG